MAKSTNQQRDSTKALFDAVAVEIAEVGYRDLSLERVANRAGVAESSLEPQFVDRTVLVEAAQEDLFERFLTRLRRACETQGSWPLKVKVGIGVTLDLAAASPAGARFLLVDTLGINRRTMQRAIGSRERLATLLAAGRTETPHGAALPGITEQVMIAGLTGVIAARAVSGEAEHLPALAPQLVELVLLPYLGSEAAAEVARRPRPAAEQL